MFDKNKFSNILKRINETYSSMTEFAQKASFDRTYISKYINLKLDNPPTPKILLKIANSSHDVTNYEELMVVCGYLNNNMKFTEIYKNIFDNYMPFIKNLELDDNFVDVFYKMILDTTKYEKEFKDLVSQLPKIKQDKVYELSAKILSDTNDILNETISNVSIRTKYKISDAPNFHSVPIVGKIAAGQPILAEEYLEGYLPVDPNIYGLSVSDDLFYLRVSGQSMNMRVKNGDYALIHKQEYAENGDIIVAIVNGNDEATLKRYKKLNEQFVLLEPMSTDPTIEPITVDLKDTKFQIIGKAIGHFGKF